MVGHILWLFRFWRGWPWVPWKFGPHLTEILGTPLIPKALHASYLFVIRTSNHRRWNQGARGAEPLNFSARGLVMYLSPSPPRNLSLPSTYLWLHIDIYLESKPEQCRILSRAKARIDRVGQQTLSDEQDTERRRHIPSSLVRGVATGGGASAAMAPLRSKVFALFRKYYLFC